MTLALKERVATLSVAEAELEQLSPPLPGTAPRQELAGRFSGGSAVWLILQAPKHLWMGCNWLVGPRNNSPCATPFPQWPSRRVLGYLLLPLLVWTPWKRLKTYLSVNALARYYFLQCYLRQLIATPTVWVTNKYIKQRIVLINNQPTMWKYCPNF